MKKIVERLVVFFVGLPVLLVLVFFFPQYHHLLLNLVIIVFCVLGALEFSNILGRKNLVVSVPETVILGAVTPAAWTVMVSFGIQGHIVRTGVFILGASWLLVSRIFTTQEKLESYINRTAAGFAVMVYPGLFLVWVIQMSAFPQASMVILVYLLITLLNDSAAWAAGVLFGKNNRGYIAASPNKSIAGFIGGLAASMIIGILAVVLIPAAFTSTILPSIPAGAILGLVVGIAAILGDLGESALKRSAGVKDSGTLILGRGGVLDSLDSPALAAPVFYIVYRILF